MTTPVDDRYRLRGEEVARNFSKAAAGYQQADKVQQLVCARLLERLELVSLKPKNVLDLGSGPGSSSARLSGHYRKAGLLEADISLAMLRQSAHQAPRFFSRRRRVCTSAEQLALATNSVDLVFSNLMLQWVNTPDAVFCEVERVLRENGLFIFSTFGPDTLVELRQSWEEADDAVHINAFIDMHDLGDALVRAGLENPVMETEKLTVQYDDALDLMRDLKRIGARNSNQGRRRSLTGKQRLRKMLAAYENRRREGKLPATYEIVYGHAWSPANMRARRIDESTLAFPVAGLRRKSAATGKQEKAG